MEECSGVPGSTTCPRLPSRPDIKKFENDSGEMEEEFRKKLTALAASSN